MVNIHATGTSVKISGDFTYKEVEQIFKDMKTNKIETMNDYSSQLDDLCNKIRVRHEGGESYKKIAEDMNIKYARVMHLKKRMKHKEHMARIYTEEYYEKRRERREQAERERNQEIEERSKRMEAWKESGKKGEQPWFSDQEINAYRESIGLAPLP